MSALSKVRAVNVSKDETKKIEEEARRMEAKLDMLRRTMDAAEPPKAGASADAGRWRSGAANKPLTKGYVKGVLEAKPKARSGGTMRASSTGRNTAATEERAVSGRPGSSGRSTPTRQPAVEAREGKVGELLRASPDRTPEAAVGSSSSRAAVNLQAHMHQQSQEGLEVEAFLAGLKLDRYVSLFMEHGFDCMEVVQEMQESHMKDIGMAPGHILKLRKRLAELAPPSAKPSTPPQGAEASKATAGRQVSFGGTEEVPLRSGTSAGTSGKLIDGGFNEEESAASFQEALRAWRQGRESSGSASAAVSSKSPVQTRSLKATTGSFWSNLGDCEMDLARASTPIKAPTEPLLTETETQRGPNPGDEKLCCYQCFKQFYAKYAVERESSLPDTGGNKVKRLCSEACAEKWTAAMEAKAEALHKRQEKLDKMQEMQRALEAERQTPQRTLESEPPFAAAVLEDPAVGTPVNAAKLTFAGGGAAVGRVVA